MNSIGIIPIRRVWNAASDLQIEGKPLTLRDIARRAGVPRSTAYYYLLNLCRAGVIQHGPGEISTWRVPVPLCTMTPQQAEVVQRWEAQHPAKEEVLA